MNDAAKIGLISSLEGVCQFSRRFLQARHEFERAGERRAGNGRVHGNGGKGIGSKKISAKLWPEKEPAKTKNIKGVTFNHLRSIISDIDGIELVFQDDHYYFKLGEAFFCDFCVLADFMGRSGPLAGGWTPDRLRLMARGPLLPHMPEALVDDFKSAFEERLTGLLIPEMIRLYDARD